MNPILKLMDTYAQTYPLPPGWRLAEKLMETHTCGVISVDLLGLIAQSAQAPHTQVTASAGSIQGDANGIAVRAYFELLERVALLDALAQPAQMHKVFTLTGQEMQTRSLAELFPESPRPAEWVYAKSNGVAAHTERDQACWRAYKELAERAIILRSWYGRVAPCTRCPLALLPSALSKQMDAQKLSLYEFSTPSDGISCIGAFIKVPQGFWAYGFASAKRSEAAALAAVEEAFQRLGFLADETVVEALPEFSPTPDYHQEYYLSAIGTERIEQWLQGAFFGEAGEISKPLPEYNQCFFVDLTPASLQGKCYVIKAFHQDITPLAFGFYPHYRRRGENDSFPHPIV
jgi:hypothetical protein